MSGEQHVTLARGHRTPFWVLLTTFLVVSSGGAWLVALPLWTSSAGLASPVAPLLLPAIMYTPAAAVFVVASVQWQRPGATARELGMWPLRPVKRVLGLTIIAVAGAPLLIAIGVFIAAGFGWVRLDLVHLSGFRETLRAAAGRAADAAPLQLIAIVQLVSIPVGALVNGLLTFGEEVGWRGWLLPRLRSRIGTWPSLVLSGAIWGLWHSPLILLGYNFGQPNVFGVFLMVVGSVSIGILFGWLRLRSGSVWPSVFAHGALNASANLVVLFSSAGDRVDPVLAGPLGAGTWIAAAIVITALVIVGQFAPARLEPIPSPSSRTSGSALRAQRDQVDG